MSAKRNLIELAAEALELPAEVALGAAKLTLIGRGQLGVVNHRGVSVYESGLIAFRTSEGLVRVEGQELMLSELNEEYLCIRGQIRALRWGEAADAD